MTTSITLLRHGETDWNAQGKIQGKSNIPLNAKGRQQAHEKASVLPNDFTRAITSPLDRAIETLDIVLKEKEIQLPTTTDLHFQERDFGSLEGQPGSAFSKDILNRPNDFETDAALIQRVMDGLEIAVREYPNDKILIAAHSHVLKAALIGVDQDSIYTFSSHTLANLASITLQYSQGENIWHITDASEVIKREV